MDRGSQGGSVIRVVSLGNKPMEKTTVIFYLPSAGFLFHWKKSAMQQTAS